MMHNTSAPPPYVTAPQPVGQQVVTVQPSPVSVGALNPQPGSGNWKGMLWTGIIQVVLGALTVIMGIVSVALFRQLIGSDIGSPIWCGILFYGVAGILGIVSGWQKNSGTAIGYMVMSIFACLATWVVIGFCAGRMGAINITCSSYYYYSYGCEWKAAVHGVYGTLIALALAEFVVSNCGASLTCGPLCCNGAPATQTVIQYQAQPHMVVTTHPQQGQVFYNMPAGQQQVAYPAQQGQYLQAQAPPIGELQHQEVVK